MKRTWGELRKRVLDLGFEKETTYAKNKDAFIRICNTTQNYLAETVCPIIDKVEINVEAVDPVYASFDIKALAAEQGKMFMGFDDKPIYTVDGNSYIPVYDYRIEQGNILLLDDMRLGLYVVWYKRYPQQITTDTADADPLEIDPRAVDIMAYFMAHDLWADDDLAKATRWWNIADQRMNELAAKIAGERSPSTYENTTGWW